VCGIFGIDSYLISSNDVCMTLRLILLDRNAVSAIKRCTAGLYVENERRLQLARLDKAKNFISPILSIIEGQSGLKESEQEIRITLNVEAAAVGRYFKRARTDMNILLSDGHSQEFIKAFGGSVELSWDQYIDFVKEVHPLLFQSIAPRYRVDTENQLFQLAIKHAVQIAHPVFFVSLAVLYGHKGARDVLKPKPRYDSPELEAKAAYNAVSDLIIFSRIGNIHATFSQNEKRFGYVRFFSFDKGLMSVYRAITQKETSIDWAGSHSHSTTSVRLSYSQALFPDLDEEGWVRLMARIKQLP
jgi:hypothetical protein